MTNTDRDDPAWQAAVEWVMREHEQPLDDAARATLGAWLGADPRHRRAYEEAARLWLITGLVPPATDVPDPTSGSCSSGR